MLASCVQVASDLYLLGREGRLTASDPTTSPGGGDTGGRALSDEVVLELGEGTEEMEDDVSGPRSNAISLLVVESSPPWGR